jgi:pyruvate dehydrogenase E2 component (dihydrolipoamide acetyltransferase)
MATDVTMPRLSDSMEEGTVLKWLVDQGGEVKRGEPLVEIETDKANMTYDADTDGVLVEILAQEGDTLAIGEVIARIGEPGEVKGDGKPEAEAEAGAGEAEEAAAAAETGAESEGARAEPEEARAEDAEEEREAGAQAEAAAGEEVESARAEAGDEAAAEGEARGAAGAEAGGGETQPGDGTGTATRERRPAGGDGDGRVKASPVARRMARELGVELAQLEGSGPGGRIVKADVEAAAGDGAKAEPAEAPPEERPPEERPAEERLAVERAPAPAREEAGPKGRAGIQDLTRLQQTIARRMAESKATAPDFSISLTVDMTNAVELRKRLKEVADPTPSYNDMVVKAAAIGLREHPRVNGAYRDGKFEIYEKVNIGVAVAAEDALVVPTVFDADTKSLGQIARDARAAAERVRDKTITPPELSGATFTVSNLGMFGIEFFTAIINPPQASILTVGKLEKRPAVDENDRVVARDKLTLSLVCDHRILYGADGAQFLGRVKELLEQPLSLAL